MVLTMKNISRIYNGAYVLDNVSLTVENTDRIGVVGVNGCGKSTLLRIIAGKEEYETQPEPDVPQLSVRRDARIGFLEQDTGLDRSSTVYEEMKSVFGDLYRIWDEMKALEHRIADEGDEGAQEEYARKTAEFESKDGYLIDVNIRKVLTGMGFGADTYDRVISTLSGGEKTRLALARLLLEAPDLLMLDEPTNHLDQDTIIWLEGYLSEYKGALLIVSHDRYFLDKLCTSICDIEQKHLRRWKGNYTTYLKLREEDDERRMKLWEAQQEEIAKLRDFVDRNIVRASTSNMAKSRQKKLESMEPVEKPVLHHKTADIRFEYDIEPPEEVLIVKDAALCAGDKTLARDVSFTVRRGDRIGITGPNGAGKSTLIKMIQGIYPCGDGKLFWNKNVKISYFDQENTQLHPDLTLIDEIHTRYRGMTDEKIRKLLGSVRLTGENVFKREEVVSCGERAKLCFALMMLERGNVLILDEPTNHLDIDTREILEEALADSTATIIFVSHDRYLLNRLSTRIIEVNGGVSVFDMGYDEYVSRKVMPEKQEKQEKQERAKAEKPVHRSKQQRSEDARKKARIKEIEEQIHGLDTELARLQEEMADPDVAADYLLLNEKCTEYEDKKRLSSELADEWLMLLDEV
ncbi:MAG: ABC-F family ATP-binding cassette domain-containing protein [Oscillospiraceae bacterium]|nr:ABC-F family ATP-binding cassette domain-containing protein [Oscillospiraceae bacterium]